MRGRLPSAHAAPSAHAPAALLSWRDVGLLSVAVVLGFGVLGLTWLLARPLAILVLAFTVAEALAPIADALDRRMSRGAAVAVVYLGLFTVIGLVGWIVLPPVINELRSLLERTPELFERLLRTASIWTGVPAEQLQQWAVAWTKREGPGVTQIPALTAATIFDTLVVVFLSLYLLVAGPSFRRFVLSLISGRCRARAGRTMTRVGRAMGGYIRGAALDGVVIGALTWMALTIIGIEYAPAFAVLAGVAEFVPYVGPILAALPAVAVAFVESPTQAVFVALAYLTLQQVDSHLIVPNIMRTQTAVHPALVIFALAAGFSLGGILGAIVAIPICAAVRVLVVSVAAPGLRLRRRHARRQLVDSRIDQR